MDYIDVVASLARTRRSGAAAWGTVLGLFALGALARWLGGARLDATPFLVFIPALPLATLAAGWRPALVLLVASLGAGLAMSGPYADGGLMPMPTQFRLLAMVLLGVFMIATTEIMTQAVQRLEAAARLNADLFRELQHRVANNFQMIAATLHHTRRRVAEPETAAALDRAMQRVDTLGRLHRRLYDPDSYAGGLKPVLADVLKDLFGAEVEVALDIDSGGLEVGRLTDIVLLVSEAATNAQKYVFAAHRGRRFAVTLTRAAGARVLTIEDDGPGFVAEAGGARLGFEIMRGLAARIGGPLERRDGPGAQLRVAFEGEPSKSEPRGQFGSLL